MTVTKDRKKELITKFQRASEDTGSAEVQIALLSERIKGLDGHFQAHVKDHSGRRGLLKLVGQRRKLLDYLKNTSVEKYKEVISELNIRK